VKSLAQARAKRARAVELLIDGLSYDEIARQVGFTHRGSAHRAVSRALAEREHDAVDTLRRVELNRLDRLQAAVWSQATGGEVAAIDLILKIIEQRMRLFGLHREPERPSAPLLVADPPAEGNAGEATDVSRPPADDPQARQRISHARNGTGTATRS
jgi:hypothetical protein